MSDDPREDEPQARAQKQLERLAQYATDMASMYRAVFNSEAGRRVLDDLRRCYGGSTLGPTPRQSDLRSAQRDVVVRIEDLLSLAAANPEQAQAELVQSPRHLMKLHNPWSDYD